MPFTPRRNMVGWFDPRILAMTGWQAAVAQVFGTYLDKREIQSLLDAKKGESLASAHSVGIDYVSDLGDGFDPTFAIAWHLAKDSLNVGGETLPRGDVLVMGGDEVYPAPTRDRYRNQTVGPYASAFPAVEEGRPSPQLLALPGNHDWYDGLSLFIEQFCTPDALGAWRLTQGRSYFAVQLPHRWWLWGVDSGLGGHIDPPQMKYFDGLVRKGDRVILCWSTPTWTHGRTHPGEHDLLRDFVEHCITSRGGVVPLYLSGDSHHFAHYESDEGVHWITAGGGGAFLHPTHHLEKDIELPGLGGAPTNLRLCSSWPSKRKSRRLLAKLLAFPRYNPSFLLFTAVLHAVLAWSVQFGLRQPHQSFVDALRLLTFGDVWNGFVRNPVALLLAALVMAGFAGFAKPPRHKQNAYRLLGVLHGALHVVLGLLVIMCVSGLLGGITSWQFTVLFLLLISSAGGILSGMLVGVYLTVTNLALRMHDNEAFSALHHIGFKHFVRMRIDQKGLTLRVIGFEKVGVRWDQSRPANGAANPPCRRSETVNPQVVCTIEIRTPTDEGSSSVAPANR